MITLPRFDRDLLILLVSFSLWPSDLLSFSRSLPARSTKLSTPTEKRKYKPVCSYITPWRKHGHSCRSGFSKCYFSTLGGTWHGYMMFIITLSTASHSKVENTENTLCWKHTKRPGGQPREHVHRTPHQAHSLRRESRKGVSPSPMSDRLLRRLPASFVTGAWLLTSARTTP